MIKPFQTKVSSFQINISLLILRLGSGALMLTHGWPKLTKLLSGAEIAFPDPIGLGSTLSFILVILAEFLGSIMIMMGLATRFAAFALAFTMAVAVFIVHADDPFAKMEMGLLYFLIFSIFILSGSGKYGLDAFISKKGH
jgi:putative oxidoreductase